MACSIVFNKKSSIDQRVLARIKADAERKRAQALRAQARRPGEPLTHNPFAGLVR